MITKVSESDMMLSLPAARLRSYYIALVLSVTFCVLSVTFQHAHR